MSLQKNLRKVKRSRRILGISSWMSMLSEKMLSPQHKLLYLGSSFWQSRALFLAVRLDVATILGDKTLSASEVAIRTNAKADPVYKLMKLLVSRGVFEELSTGYFRNNNVSDYLRSDNPGNVRSMILVHNSPEMSDPWFKGLEDCARSGKVAFEDSHRQTFFDYIENNPAFDNLFSDALDCAHILTGDSFVTEFDWSAFNRIIDISLSKGSQAVEVLKKHRYIEVKVVARSKGISSARYYWADKATPAILNRMTFHTGSIMESLPQAVNKKDIFLINGILRGYSDRDCVIALRNVVKAIGNTGAYVAIMELILEEQKYDTYHSPMDLQTMISSAGKERTAREWKAIFKNSGLQLKETVWLKPHGNIMVLQAIR